MKCCVCGCDEGFPSKFIGNFSRVMCSDCMANLDDYADGFEEYREMYYAYADALDEYNIMYQRACRCSATLDAVQPYRDNLLTLEEKLHDFIVECIDDLTNLARNG